MKLSPLDWRQHGAQKSYAAALVADQDAALVRNLLRHEAEIPHDTLLRAVSAFCASPEAFVVVRARFARSFAVFNICSYILGEWGRHSIVCAPDTGVVIVMRSLISSDDPQVSEIGTWTTI